MPVQGVNPSYFAGMQTVALDPTLFKENPQYAQMLSQAMQNRAAQTARRREEEEQNAFKARELDQQARRDRLSNEISKRNAAVSEAGEARLKSGQEFAQDRLKGADTEHILDALAKAKKAQDQAAYNYFMNELQRRGYSPKQESDADFAERMKPPPEEPRPPDTAAYGEPWNQMWKDTEGGRTAAPPDRSPMPPRSPPPVARFPDVGTSAAPSPVAPAPRLSAAPATPAPATPPRDTTGYGEGWDQVLKDTAVDTSRARPAAPTPRDTSAYGAPWGQLENDLQWHPPTEKELLDKAIADVVTREKSGVPAPAPKPLLPGKTLRRQAAESDFLLSPDDPLLNKPRAQ